MFRNDKGSWQASYLWVSILIMLFIPEHNIGPNRLSNYIVEVTQNCNFRCKYCCFSGDYVGFRHHNTLSMSGVTAKKTIDFIRHHTAEEGPIYVSFYGGESLLKFDLIKTMITALREHFGNRMIFDISTNGWLLGNDIVDYILSVPNVNVSVSLDGIAEIHDRNRLHVSGTKTYDKIVANLLHFKGKNKEEYYKRIRILITVGSLEDINTIDKSFDALKPLTGEKPLLISHLLPNFSKRILYRDSFEHKKIFIEEALRFKKAGKGNLHTMIFDELQHKRKRKFDCSDCTRIKLHTCINNLQSCFINVNGIIYPCEKVKQDCAIGDISTGFYIKKIRKLAVKYTLWRNMVCRKCKYIAYCKRCLIDLNFSLQEQKLICEDYKENIDLALKYNYE